MYVGSLPDTGRYDTMILRILIIYNNNDDNNNNELATIHLLINQVSYNFVL